MFNNLPRMASSPLLTVNCEEGIKCNCRKDTLRWGQLRTATEGPDSVKV